MQTHVQNDYGTGEPPTNRRRRAHTIQWDTSANPANVATASTTQATAINVNYPRQESLEPVNFGSTSCNSKKSSMSLRTASSGSLTSHTSYASFASGDASQDSSGINAMNGGSGGCPSPGPGSASKAQSGGGNTRNAAPATSLSNTNSTAPTKDKRLKRLERNRESARLSRRRRKQYLEELEVRVTSMSEEMDRGRIQHASAAVRTLRGMRLQKLMEVERLVFGSGGVGGSAGLSNGASGVSGYAIGMHGENGFYGGTLDGPSGQRIMGNSKVGVNNPLAYDNYEDGDDNGESNNNSNDMSANHIRKHLKPRPASTISSISKPLLEQHLRPLQTSLSRTNNELQIVNLFLKQQLMSMVQPSVTKLVLWLTLQNEGFYRGGRAQSERLSAARIGERILHSGKDKATPSEEMWPLICHEISLSYDQEDKIRQCQRAILANNASWVSRHTAVATKNVIDSIQTTIGGMHETAKRRERPLLNVLTIEQRVAFLAWAARRSASLRRIAESKVGPCNDEEAQKWRVFPHRHVAANLYITDHHLSRVKQHLPPTARFANPTTLKKLSRRPSFESLAGQDSDSNPKLNRDTSFPSTGSLKRSLGEVMGEDSGNNHVPITAHSAVTPESAQVAAKVTVAAVLKDVLAIIPKTSFQYAPQPLPQYRTYAPAVPPHAAVNAPAAVLKAKNQTKSGRSGISRNPLQSPLPQPLGTAAVNIPVAAPSPDPIDDIPMPTPVSVLIRTSDEFISPYPTQPTCDSSFVPRVPPQLNGAAVPEQVASSIEPNNEVRHQSAPQLSTAPQADFTYPALLPAPMGMIPVPEDGALVNNPFHVHHDPLLDDLAMDAGDWAIGEGFDMEL